MMGGIVIDLCTGEEMLTDEQAKGLARNPDAEILIKDGDAPAWEDMRPVSGYSPSEQAAVLNVWLESYRRDGVMYINVELAEPGSSYVRITVPVDAIGY